MRYPFIMTNDQVLVAGAGPTGLVLALWLTHMGVKVRLIDKAAEPGTTSRALAVQARTLEFYQQVGLAQTVVDRGHKVAALNLWVGGGKPATVPLKEMGQGLSPFAFPMIFPQDEHEPRRPCPHNQNLIVRHDEKDTALWHLASAPA